jgi:hypothetical protein
MREKLFHDYFQVIFLIIVNCRFPKTVNNIHTCSFLEQKTNKLKRNMLAKRIEVSTPDDELYIDITEG